LKQQHIGILDASKVLTDLLAGTFADAAAHLGLARMTIARLISEHLKSEDDILHAPLRAHKLTVQIPSYAAVAADTRDLRLRYSAHIVDWPARAVEANWQAYVIEARRLGEAVTALATREEQEIYPAAQRLLAEVDHI
jgi:hypothetical protein